MDQDVADAAATYDIDLYPAYADPASPTGIWVGPGPNNPAPAYLGNTYSAIRNASKTLPNNTAAVDALCEAGCYAPDQRLRFGDDLVPVASAYKSDQRGLMTLAPGSTLDSIELMGNKVARWTVDIAPTEQEILTIKMKSRGELRVTTEHPLLTSEGVMKKATDLRPGDSLIAEDGSPDPITSVDRKKVFTKVYNLRPVTTDLISNILVAQGYFSGSARYQSEYVKYLNRVLVRRNIPPALIPRGTAAQSAESGGASGLAHHR
jgi:hypothetical protein